MSGKERRYKNPNRNFSPKNTINLPFKALTTLVQMQKKRGNNRYT